MQEGRLKKTIILGKTGVERLEKRHPWVFWGQVLSSGDASPGDLVPAGPAGKAPLAWGFWSGSDLSFRALSFGPVKPDVKILLSHRLGRALSWRRKWCPGEAAFRLVHGEGDGLPGLVADIYGPVAVLQFLCTGWYLRKELVLDSLRDLLPLEAAVLRNDVRSLFREGLPQETGVLFGRLPSDGGLTLPIGSILQRIYPLKGQKTGTYLDVREFPAQLAEGWREGRVLDCFSYTGQFGLTALRAGAGEVLAVEQSREAIGTAEENLELNGLPRRITWLEGNAFDILRDLEKKRERFSSVILDPPPFSPSRARVDSAKRGYKDLAIRGLRLLAPGGCLFFLSCSHAFSRDLLLSTLGEAAWDTGSSLRILREFHQPADHPALLSVPETEYLKGFLAGKD